MLKYSDTGKRVLSFLSQIFTRIDIIIDEYEQKEREKKKEEDEEEKKKKENHFEIYKR